MLTAPCSRRPWWSAPASGSPPRRGAAPRSPTRSPPSSRPCARPGLSCAVGPLTLAAGLTTYIYPGGDSDCVEGFAAAEADVLGATRSLAGALAPSQRTLGHAANRYVEAAVSRPLGPGVSVTGRVGREAGAFGPADGVRRHRELTLVVDLGPFEAGAAWVDTDEGRPGRDATLVFSLGSSF